MLTSRLPRRSGLISIVIALCCAAPSRSAVTLSESKHPAHFVLLIDASGSTMASQSRRRAYEAVLLKGLLPRLYSGRLSTELPPFDSRQDLVSILHFGAVDRTVRQGLKELGLVDFLQEEVHPVRIAIAQARREDIANWVVPDRTYQYTLFYTLAKQLAIETLPQNAGDRRISRTYLIVVTDRLANEGSPDGELAMLHRWGNPQQVKKALTAAGQIDATYSITLLQQPIRLGASYGLGAVVVEAYEVSPRDRIRDLGDFISRGPLAGLKVRWTHESGRTPQGVITGDVRNIGSSRLFPVDVQMATGTLAVGSPPPAVRVTGPSFSIPFQLQGPSPCQQLQIPIFLRGTIESSDPRLGLRRAEYEERTSVFTPIPSRCVSQLKILRIAVGAALVLILFVFFFIRRYRPNVYTRILVLLRRSPHPFKEKSYGTDSAGPLAPVDDRPDALAARGENQIVSRRLLFTVKG